MKPMLTVVLVAALLLMGNLACWAAAEQIGVVKSMAGEVTIARGGQTIKVAPNLKLFEGDLIKTGAKGKVGLILEDDTVISMGPNSKLLLAKFMFQPSEKRLSLVVRVFRGTVSFICGQIARLAPGVVHIETPYATVGVRGTHVLIQVD